MAKTDVKIVTVPAKKVEPEEPTKKATVRITPTAWMKMQTLVMGYDKEVAWFGTCEQVDSLDFRIKDILLFPQYTSGCYVDDERDDPLEFCKWLDTLSDEEFEQRRFHGHSHVNMTTFPSGTDDGMFQRFAHTSCAALVNRFAICVILNKRCDMYWWVYDGETDREYKKDAVNVIIEVDDKGLSSFEYFESSKPLVKDIRPATSFLYNKGYYSGYGSSSFGSNHEKAEGYNFGSYNKYVASRSEVADKKPAANTEPVKEEKPEVKSVVADSYAGYRDELYDDELDEYYNPYDDPYGDSWVDRYYAQTHSDDDDVDDDGYIRIYDVEITADEINVLELTDDSSFNYKTDLILEDELTGDVYRFTITEDELDQDHPVQDNSVVYVLIEDVLTIDLQYFSLWKESNEEGGITALSANTSADAIDLLTAKVHAVEVDDNVVMITIENEKDEEGGAA